MSPWVQETGSLAGSRHSLHDANGKNESRDSRALVEFHADFARDLSCEVKTARDVLRLLCDILRSLDEVLSLNI